MEVSWGGTTTQGTLCETAATAATVEAVGSSHENNDGDGGTAVAAAAAAMSAAMETVDGDGDADGHCERRGHVRRNDLWRKTKLFHS